MTHDELLKGLDEFIIVAELKEMTSYNEPSLELQAWRTLKSIVQLHTPELENPRCKRCGEGFPCSEIELILEGLK
jgi:predicted aldo/keto reductase-like oxidoreductase